MTRAANGAICGPCRACMAERDALKAALVLETERCGEWATNAAMWAAERDELRFRLTKQQEAREAVEAERDVLKADVERLEPYERRFAEAGLRIEAIRVERDRFEAAYALTAGERDQARARIESLEESLHELVAEMEERLRTEQEMPAKHTNAERAHLRSLFPDPRATVPRLIDEIEALEAVLERVLRWIDNSDSTYDLELFVRAALAPPEAKEGEGK